MDKRLIQKEKQDRAGEQGNILLGMVIGLVLGLGIALAAAYFIQKNPPSEKPNFRAPEIPTVPKVHSDGTIGNEIRDPNSPIQSNKSKIPEKPTENTSIPEAVHTAPPTEVRPTYIYWIQAGAYVEKAMAENQKGQLALQGVQAKVTEFKTDTQSTWRVRVGPYNEIQDLSDDKTKLDNAGISYSVIKANKP